ncbi:energy-coupling factor ABC transporter ATP-binding protein [Lentibacillus halophilus]|uniref:Energy-coupling factor ABC transporter ATP-binding protein n=1 Tax=Lentibacillus halophilus TaxID=295065 RepID=A0ABP3J1Q1_9BACI
MRSGLVEFRNVSFRYGENEHWVLNDCSFTIYENEAVAIIGHNGSGKSTIAKLMNGLLFPQKGEIIVNGKQINAETVWNVRQDVGMVFQNPDNQFVGTTVQDDVAFGMENRGIPRDDMLKRIDNTLTSVDMQRYRLTEPHKLSGGQKQRVAIAGVLAVYPNVLIMDEATAMLDPKGRKEIMRTVTDVRQNRHLSLITITHDLREVVEAERVIVMNEGKVWDESTPRGIFAKKTELRSIGLDIPFVAVLSDELRKAGVPITHEALNQDELLEELWISRLTM